MAPILGRCKKVTEMGVMVKSEAEGPKLREGVRERRNWSPEFYEEQRVPD